MSGIFRKRSRPGPVLWVPVREAPENKYFSTGWTVLNVGCWWWRSRWRSKEAIKVGWGMEEAQEACGLLSGSCLLNLIPFLTSSWKILAFDYRCNHNSNSAWVVSCVHLGFLLIQRHLGYCPYPISDPQKNFWTVTVWCKLPGTVGDALFQKELTTVRHKSLVKLLIFLNGGLPALDGIISRIRLPFSLSFRKAAGPSAGHRFWSTDSGAPSLTPFSGCVLVKGP